MNGRTVDAAWVKDVFVPTVNESTRQREQNLNALLFLPRLKVWAGLQTSMKDSSVVPVLDVDLKLVAWLRISECI